MQKIIISLLLFCFSLLYGNVHPKAIDLSVSNYTIGQSLLEYEDTTATMTLSKVRQLSSDNFKLLNKAVASHPFTHSAFWYQFKVVNKENSALSRLMVFEPAWLDSVNITVISPKGQLQTYQGGNIYPYSQRELDHYLINFKHDFEPGISTVYIQVKTRDPFIVSLSILEESAFLTTQVEESLYTGLIYGGIAAMLFYNLFLFFGIKQRFYLYYVLFLGAFFVMNASYNGYTFMYFLSDQPTVQNWLQAAGIYLFVITALLFSSSFLDLEKYHKRLYKITAYLIFLIITIAVLTALFGGYHYHVMLSIIMVMFVSIYIFVMSLYSWLDGNRSARFFLLGVASGLIGAIITALTVLSFIPFSYMTYKANDFGMLIDAVLLSIALADRVKISLEKTRIVEKESRTDVITGLLNRRAYSEMSFIEYQRLLRHQRALSVIIFDVDHFKRVNDTYGHDAGDYILKSVGSIVRGVIREYDYAFRMGGDEFLLLLPETNEKQASLLAERIRLRIENKKLVDEHNNKFSVTASFGISQNRKIDTSIENIVKRADKALYKAKERGRNKVEIMV
ncbi:diguanylate cyclase [Sulfurovum sp.]|uniref:sensor domain-containing diguanylate cyclase n=1 Tax=Sulfurovum sp. TaxID=1969726 RepID=UPI0035630E16